MKKLIAWFKKYISKQPVIKFGEAYLELKRSDVEFKGKNIFEHTRNR